MRRILISFTFLLFAFSASAQESAFKVAIQQEQSDASIDSAEREQARPSGKGFWPVTDQAMMKSLNGEWQLKVIKGIYDNKQVPAADDSWGRIPVPGCWESFYVDAKTGKEQRFSEPHYSFPDSLTGYYRTEFSIPKAWKGKQVVIRLDGVLRGYDLWLNDQLVGTWESGYNTCLFDLTPYLTERAFKGEPQQLAMRVYSRFKGFEFDCFDDWAPMGIHRDVMLMAVPTIHLSDLTVTTKMNGEVTVKTEVANATKHTTTSFQIMDAQGKIVSTGGPIVQPHLWTAETPYLYTLRVFVKEKGKTLQTFEQKIGIREVSIDGNILKVNGQPIKLRGVTCHATDPNTVKVISDDLTLKDMRLMKEASVNYIRTSHYPREPRFYELCDSLGFYVVNEVSMGSRGEKNLSKPDYQDIMRTHVAATMPRDKNHPSVIVWSIGNENPLPKSCQALGEYAKTFDATRPICYPQKGSYFRSVGFEKFPKVADIYAPHYPTTSVLRDYYTKTDRPLIFTEYCHTLGISFEDHDRQWEIIERTPGIAGGSVWEWVDQGMPFRNEERGTRNEERGKMYGYNERVFTSADGGFEMKGNFGTDGLLYADRTPLPNYYELQHNYARAFVSIDHLPLTIDHSSAHDGLNNHVQCSMFNVQCTNRYDFLNLKNNVRFHWALTANRDTVARGTFSPDCPPRTSVPYDIMIPNDALTTPRFAHRILHFDIEDAQGHTFLHQSFVVEKPLIKWTGTGDPMTMVQQTLVRAGRKATMAERITQKGRLPEQYLLPLYNDQVKADVSTTRETFGTKVTFTLTPDTANIFRAELGLAYLLDKSIDRVQWLGHGPFAGYPGRHQANRYGLWAKHMDDLYFEGNHHGVDAALLTDSLGNGLLVVGDSLDLNFEQTDRGIVLTVNAAVSGQGPKFAKTAFNGWKKEKGPVSATFRLYRIEAKDMPQTVKKLFLPAADVPAPFRPFLTQYDTYLMKLNDPLQGKKIGVLGDSYVRNHREPIENTWHYKFAQKHQMEYYNYGKNGNCIALDLKKWGKGMYQRYKDMRDDLDYVVVIAGHNDASQGRIDSIGIDTFRARLATLCQGLRERYPRAQIVFFTPWNCEDFEGSVRQQVVDTMISVCGSYNIPIFDAARHSGIDAASDQFRSIYFQGGGKNDHAHLNAKGHDLFLPVAEEFLLKQMKKKAYNVVFIGNSITYGALHQQRELTAPPAQCARWLSQQQGVDTVYFKNCGRSGRTTYHFLPLAEDVVPAGDKTYFGDVVSKTRQLVSAHPTAPLLFSIMLGTNDSVERLKNSHTTPEDYVRNLTAIIDSLLTLWPDAHVVLNKPIWYTPDYQTKNGSVASKKSLKLLSTYYNMFARVIDNCKPGHVHIGDSQAYAYFEKHYKTDIFEEKDARGRSYYLHPNEQGARKLAECWGQALLPVMGGIKE